MNVIFRAGRSGGSFAWLNEPRTVHCLSPDTFEWEDLELGYSDVHRSRRGTAPPDPSAWMGRSLRGRSGGISAWASQAPLAKS